MVWKGKPASVTTGSSRDRTNVRKIIIITIIIIMCRLDYAFSCAGASVHESVKLASTLG